MVINHIVTIRESTGKILGMQFPSNDIPEEGVSGDFRYVYIVDNNYPDNFTNTIDFIDNWCWQNDQFERVGEKPNKHALWDRNTQSWTWDENLMLQDIRDLRNGKLRSSDWTMLSDSQLTGPEKADAVTYRQELRDFPATVNNPSSLDELVWPAVPSFLQ